MKQAKVGFTLIELLVVITISMLVVGGGLVSFIRFNDKQTVLGAAKELQQFLRSGQVKARVGERPASCSKLESYQVKALDSLNEVEMVAICDFDVEVGEPKKLKLPNQVLLGGAFNIRFLVLHGGVENPGILTVSDGSRSYSFEVTAGGEISEGAWDGE